MEIPVTLQSDRKGYFDRECPNENCLYTFKINMNDWEEKVSDEEVHCPCCGHNSAVDAFEESMDSIEKMLSSLPEMKEMLTTSYGRDKAETMCRSLLESSLGDIVSAFQKFAACHYDKLTGKTSRVNDFQMVEKGSLLFKEATRKGYEEWLSDMELQDMNVMFQRRHLVEHNNGMVDMKYIDKSGDNSYVEGQRLVIKEKDALNLHAIIKKLGAGLSSIKAQ